MRVGRNGSALAAFLTGTLLAGGNAVGVRVSNRELEPLWGAAFRFLLAAALLGLAMAALRLPFPRGRALHGVVLYGALIFGGAFSFAYYALVELHAGLGQTLLAIVPLAILRALRTDRIRRAFYERYWPGQPLVPEIFALTLNTSAVPEEKVVDCVLPIVPLGVKAAVATTPAAR